MATPPPTDANSARFREHGRTSKISSMCGVYEQADGNWKLTCNCCNAELQLHGEDGSDENQQPRQALFAEKRCRNTPVDKDKLHRCKECTTLAQASSTVPTAGSAALTSTPAATEEEAAAVTHVSTLIQHTTPATEVMETAVHTKLSVARQSVKVNGRLQRSFRYMNKETFNFMIQQRVRDLGFVSFAAAQQDASQAAEDSLMDQQAARLKAAAADAAAVTA